MDNLITNFMVSVIAYYFCRLLDEIGTYLKNFIEEIWNTYFPSFPQYAYLFFIFYISLIAYWISFSVLNLNTYTIVIYV